MLVVAVVVVSAVGFVVGSAATGTAINQVDSNATAITECRVIDEPGRYVLASNVTVGGSDPCIYVQADDVVLDGDGYVFDATTADDYPDAVGNAAGVENLTVRNAVIEGRSEIQIGDATDVTVESSDVRKGVIDLVDVTGATVTGNDVYTLGLEGVENATVDRNDVGWKVEEGTGGIAVTESRNRPSSDVTLSNNTVRYADSGVVVAGGSSNVTVRHNLLTNNTKYGVELWTGETNDVRVVRNNVTENGYGGIDGAGAETEIHRNNILDNDELGVKSSVSEYRDVVNATGNYWGAADGPGSPTDPQEGYEVDEDAPYVDPYTGTLADGSGDEVSGFADDDMCGPGLSNVYFDPWLDHPVTDAGPRNGTAS